MKLKKLLTLAVGLSCVGSANTPKLQNKPYPLKDNFPKQVLQDTRQIREVREDYNIHSEQQKKQYDETVVKVADCFSGMPVPEKWDEVQTILDIHDCSLQNNYPNIQPLDEVWEKKQQEGLMEARIQIDKMDGSGFVSLEKIQKLKLPESAVTFDCTKPLIIQNRVVDNILIDNKPVIERIRGNEVMVISRTPLIQTQFSKNKQYRSQFPKELKGYIKLVKSSKIMRHHLNKIANKLLEGDFKDQKQAINLLLEYKILSSLPFSIEGQKGTQFKNIIKMKYLTEAIKEKYPEKIDPNLNIPHIVDDNVLKYNPFLQNPEIAVTLFPLQNFKKIQKRQIKQELKKNTDT